MSNLFELLAGGLPSETEYRADNPFYTAGRGFAQTQFQPRTSSEAIWMPAAQGLLSGLLQGVGKGQARQAQYSDIKALPGIQQLLAPSPDFIGPPDPMHAYTSETAPEGWTPKIGKADMIMAALSAQTQQEEALRKAEHAAKFEEMLANKYGAMITPEGNISAIPQLREIQAANVGAEEKAKTEAKLKAENSDTKWFDKLPTPSQAKLTQAVGITEELKNLAKDYKNLNQSAVEFQVKRLISGTEANRLESKMRIILPGVIRLSGEVGNLAEQEQARALAATLGNITSGTEGVAERLQQVAELQASLAKKQAESFKKGFTEGGDTMLNRLNAPPKPSPADYSSFAEYKAAKDAWRASTGG